MDETNVDVLLQRVVAADAATTLEAALAHARSPATRQTASSRGDRLQERLLEKQKREAALEASRSDADRERLKEQNRKTALARGGVSLAEQAGTDPRDGETAGENYRERERRKSAKKRRRGAKRKAKDRAARGVDHKTAALEKKASRSSKISETKKRSRDDPGSGRMVYCKTEGCVHHGKEVMQYGSRGKVCTMCFRTMAFVAFVE